MSEDLFSKALEEPNMEVHLPTLNDDVIADELSNDEALVVNPETNSTEENTSVEKIAEENTSEEGSDDSSSSSGSDSESDSDDSSSANDAENGGENDGDANSDIEEDDSNNGPIKSKHEVVEEPIIELPADYKIDEKTNIKDVGKIKSIFDNNIIIQANISGERRVLKEGSIFCLNDRTLMGKLTEVFGLLTNPVYRIMLPSTADMDVWRGHIGEQVNVVISDAHWIDTFELRKYKGTDASNGFDEEIPESEQEFSDDEKEANYKKLKKQQKKSGSSSTGNKNNDSNKVTKQTNLKNMKPKQMKFPVSNHQFNGNTSNGSSYRSRDSRQGNTERNHTENLETKKLIPVATPAYPQLNGFPMQPFPIAQAQPLVPSQFNQYSNFNNAPPQQPIFSGYPQQQYPMQNSYQQPMYTIPHSQQPMYPIPHPKQDGNFPASFPPQQVPNPMQQQHMPQQYISQQQMPQQQQHNMEQVLQLHQLIMQQQQSQQPSANQQNYPPSNAHNQ